MKVPHVRLWYIGLIWSRILKLKLWSLHAGGGVMDCSDFKGSVLAGFVC